LADADPANEWEVVLRKNVLRMENVKPFPKKPF
jgi:hypothetical protein